MGGFSGGASTGGGGGSGPAGRKTDGSYGTKRDAQRASRRNEGRKAAKEIGDFIKGGGVTGALVRGITKTQKQKNKTTKGGDVFGGEAYGYNEADEKRDFIAPKNNQPDNDRDNSNETRPEGIEVAKASTPTNEVSKTQADAVSEAPKGPTSIEMAQAEEDAEAKRLLKIKREGRKSTILNIPEEELTLSKKVLLG